MLALLLMILATGITTAQGQISNPFDRNDNVFTMTTNWSKNMKILLMSGSFHTKSRSIAILNSIKGYFPECQFELPCLKKIPFYDEDLTANKPKEVEDLMELVASSNGIIVCSPEYNHSVPAVLKNAIDWVSRPAFNSVLKAKPITIITQANSPVGGARAQAHLKLIFDSTLSSIHPSHEMMISSIDQVVGENFKVVDSKVENRLKRHLSDFFNSIQR